MAVDREAALETLVELMGEGYAGLDALDSDRFVVDAPEPFLTAGENAIDDLGGYLLTTSHLGVKPSYVAAVLPRRAYLELGLDAPDAPRVAAPGPLRVRTELPAA